MADGPKIHVSRHLTRLTMDAQAPSVLAALVRVFDRYQVAQLDQEVLIHFAMRELDATPDTYFMVAGVAKQLLRTHPRFTLSQGPMRESYESLEVRRINIHLAGEPATLPPRRETPVARVKVSRRR